MSLRPECNMGTVTLTVVTCIYRNYACPNTLPCHICDAFHSMGCSCLSLNSLTLAWNKIKAHVVRVRVTNVAHNQLRHTDEVS